MSIEKIIEQANGIFKDKAKLTALKNPFGGDVFFEPTEINFRVINFPKPNQVLPGLQDVSVSTLQDVERYGSFVARKENPTVSIYDELKMEGAVADCKEQGEMPNQFLLVSADFSGIQDTVYTISSKGALKTLRARSFMLELLTEHIIYELIGENRYQIIHSGGGGFSLLMPNTKHNRETTEKFRDILNTWAIKEFSGRFFIALDAHQFSDISKFATARREQSESLDKQKRQKFLNQLEIFFAPQMPKQTSAQTECQITRRDDLENSDMCDLETGEEMDETNKNDENKIWVSKSCYRQFKMGDALISAHYVYRSEDTPVGIYYEFPKKENGYAYYYITEKKPAQSQRWRINNFEYDCYTLLYANYVRKINDLPVSVQMAEAKLAHQEQRNINTDDTATLDGLAASSCGADLIGALRMDVDNLGKNFQHIQTPEELSQKSRLLNLFFKAYLTQICATNLNGIEPTNIVSKDYSKGRNVSIIYAGGDDLFIIGAWDETTELAFDIQKCFYQFTGGNENNTENRLGISAGLTLHHPKFPLYQMAKKSGEAEGIAKNDREQNENSAKKNRIALFFDDNKTQRRNRLAKKERYMLSMKWTLADEFLIPLMKVYGECGKITESQDRKVFTIDKFSYSTIEKWFAIIEKYQETGKMYMPTMARVLNQIQKDSKLDEELFSKLLKFLYSNDSSKRNWISHLHIALNWLSYLRRTK